jgi:DNA repair protein RecN (Recombination protein N)
LASARALLTGAERLGRLCEESYGLLYDDDGSALSSLAAVWKRVDELASLDPVFRPFVETRDAIKAQLDDLALQLRRYADSIEVNPARLAQVEERLALLERLKRKHGPSLDDVLARQRSLQAERDELEQGTDRVALQQRVRAEAANAYAERAADLSRQRRLAATGFARSMEQLLADLAMERTRFEVRFEEALPEAEWSADGVDRGEFFLAPNVGEEPRALARIVSGGELSRVMLALKTLIAARRFGLSDDARRPPGTSAPGLVFDEVDAGIGGRVADVVGARLRGLGAAFQVLCITHLPQIAAYADSHFVIEKREEQGRTLTSVRKLDQAGRTEELSRMLGGVTVSAQMRASAEEMLAARRRGAGERTGERAGDRKEPPTNGAKAKGETNAKGESESPTAAKAKTGRQPRRTEA